MQFRKLSLVVAALLSGQASAAGFQLAETSATGLGRAYAGAAALADNAASQGRNAAMLLALDGMQISTGAIYIDPNVEADGNVTVYSPVDGSPIYQEAANVSELVPSAVVPNFFFSHKLNDTWAYGIGLISNYGLASELPSDDHGAAFLGTKTEVTTVELNPNVAYAINDHYSIGFGLRVLYAEGEIVGNMPGWADPINAALIGAGQAPAYPPGGTVLRSVVGDDSISYGYNLGFHWRSNEGHSLGLAYHSAIDLGLEGDYKVFNPASQSHLTLPASMDVTLPGFAELAAAHQLTPNLRMSASVKWTDWSEFTDLEVKLENGVMQTIKEETFKDNWRFAVGADLRTSDKWLWRGGIAYDQTAVDDEHRSLSIPDSSRLWLSTGMAYEASEQLTLDFSLTYLTSVGDSPVVESSPELGATFDGEVTGDAILAGVQATYRF
ncbi:outer membrane protein transport protein [uncultured Ferrimonas sp.]|uniref:OmpP1/FadL family transporter n=1 Tax=uncultured Ferrimonas sp. TaxID=432640 RepID=UPI0026341C5C|nr:outer membrane protein transport protein [uncultured Ferrimonas sp.]